MVKTSQNGRSLTAGESDKRFATRYHSRLYVFFKWSLATDLRVFGYRSSNREFENSRIPADRLRHVQTWTSYHETFCGV